MKYRLITSGDGGYTTATYGEYDRKPDAISEFRRISRRLAGRETVELLCRGEMVASADEGGIYYSGGISGRYRPRRKGKTSPSDPFAN